MTQPITLGRRTCRFCGRVHRPDFDPDSCLVLAEEARRKPVDEAIANALARLMRDDPRRESPVAERDKFPPDADLWQFEAES